MPVPRSEPQASGEVHQAGFEVRRHVFYLGRWIDHGGWYPDWKLRLVRRGRARWGGVDPHDKLIADGPVGRLDGELVHFTYGNFSDHLRTVQRFSDVVSDVQAREGRRFSLVRAIAPSAREVPRVLDLEARLSRRLARFRHRRRPPRSTSSQNT